MSRRRRLAFIFLGLTVVLVGVLASWVQWGDWPQPVKGEVFRDADALVVLGGGDGARYQHGLLLARKHPDLPVIVTGDAGSIVAHLTANGIPESRILHENAATSTVENATFTREILAELNAHKVILVTNWFHAPRAKRIFEKFQLGRAFCVSFAPKPDPMRPWDEYAHRRERLAALHNLVFHGVWSW